MGVRKWGHQWQWVPVTWFLSKKKTQHTKCGGGVPVYARHCTTWDPRESPTLMATDYFIFFQKLKISSVPWQWLFSLTRFFFSCEKTHMYLNANYKPFKVKGYPNTKHRYSHFFLPKDLSNKVFLYNNNYYIWHSISEERHARYWYFAFHIMIDISSQLGPVTCRHAPHTELISLISMSHISNKYYMKLYYEQK